MHRLICVTMLVPALLCVAVSVSADIPQSERDVLIALYNATDGDNWLDNTGWLGAAGTECSWYGVTCDVDGTTVQGLILHDNQLNGTLPLELGNLSNLQWLYLHTNQLIGSLPPELGNLTALGSLGLAKNQLTGDIPAQLGNLTALGYLGLAQNQLTGTIPAQLGNLTELRYLYLCYNQLSGTIPPELTNLSNLRFLQLYDNQLSGSLPTGLANLGSLTDFCLWNNQLSGTVPSELGSLASLVYLDLGRNQLTGTIPQELANLGNLEVLSVYHNNMTGTIPPELGGLSDLIRLSLGFNQLSGTIPPELGSLTQLQSLDLCRGALSGTIPPVLGSLTGLQELLLFGNQLSGTIPPELGSLVDLEILWLEENQLTGTIPPGLGDLTKLEVLSVWSNQLTGSVPSEVGNLANLRWLFLDGNRLGGPIPAALGDLGNLEWFYLSSNQLVGPIPDELMNLGALTRFNPWFNGLYTDNSAVLDFIAGLIGGTFGGTQTVAPESVTATPESPGSILVSWTPIHYTWNDGGYRVCRATSSGGPFDSCSQTADKTLSWLTVDGLSPGQVYYFQVRSFTYPHEYNQGTVISEPSEIVTSTTAPAGVAGSLQLSGSEYRASEGETKAITVRRLGGATGEVSVHYATEDGTATAGADYTDASGTLTWADGEGGAKTFVVSVIDDAVREGEESVAVSLSDPTGGAILGSPITATLLISDNDLSEEYEADANSVGSEPSVATDPLGNRVVVWAEARSDGSGSDILAQLYDPNGLSVGPRFKANDASEGEHHSAQVECSAVGDFVVVWVETSTTKGLAQQTGDAVFCRFFDSSGQPLTEDIVVDDGSAGSGGTPDVAVEPDTGRAAIVWKRAAARKTGLPIGQGDEDAIFARLFDPTGGAVTQSITVDDGTQGDPEAPAVAANATGQVVVVWQRLAPETESFDVFARMLDLPKNLAGPEIPVNSDTWRDQGEPAVVMNADGEFLVAWQGPSEPGASGQRESGTDIFARGFDASGTPLHTQFRVNSSEPGAQKAPQLVMSPDGDCTAAWASESADGTTGIFARQISNCDPSPKSMGQEAQVNDFSDGLPTRLPSAAMNDDGTVTVVYVKDDVTEGDWGVFGRALNLLPGACSPGPTTLCLNDGRFEVEVDWVAFDGASGPGQAVQLTSDTGYFWFFDEANVEMVVKVLDGTWMNGYYWVFYGALSNVEYTMTVVDTETGNSKTYSNPSGTFASAGDTEALPGDGKRAFAPGSSGPPHVTVALSSTQVWHELLSEAKVLDTCTPGANNLCLNNDRFRVEVDWVDFEGVPGQGNAVGLTGDTGYFWFFDDANVELIVKVLDARAINGHYWVFYGALSNVEYTITVTDTSTDEVKEYVNPSGEFASQGDTEAFAVP